MFSPIYYNCCQFCGALPFWGPVFDAQDMKGGKLQVEPGDRLEVRTCHINKVPTCSCHVFVVDDDVVVVVVDADVDLDVVGCQSKFTFGGHEPGVELLGHRSGVSG